MVLQRDDPRPLPTVAAYMQREGVYSVLLVPILLGQRSIGLVELHDTRAIRRFDPAEIEMVQTMAAQIGVAIRHAELHHQLQAQRVAEQANQLKLTRRLLRTTERQQVAETALESIGEAFDVTCGLFFAPAGAGRAAQAGGVARLGRVAGKQRLRTGVCLADSSVQYAMEQGEIVKVEDAFARRASPCTPTFCARACATALIAPLLYNDETLGVIVLYRQLPGGFSDDDVQVLSLLCYQVTVALERARL